jgi:hypothetical protein
VKLLVARKPTVGETTFGQLFVDGAFECYTLEDAIREIPGEPVDLWKIKDRTAIPSGMYRLTLADSPHFGPDTLTINDVPGFDLIRIHSGLDAGSTEGCVIVGDHIDTEHLTISGGLVRGVKKRLQAKVKTALALGQEAWITIENPA